MSEDLLDFREQGDEKLSRKELLEKALRRVKEKLETDEDLPQGTIGNLVQLLKLDRDIVIAEDVPHEIRVLWQEMKEESSSDE